MGKQHPSSIFVSIWKLITDKSLNNILKKKKSAGFLTVRQKGDFIQKSQFIVIAVGVC